MWNKNLFKMYCVMFHWHNKCRTYTGCLSKWACAHRSTHAQTTRKTYIPQSQIEKFKSFFTTFIFIQLEVLEKSRIGFLFASPSLVILNCTDLFSSKEISPLKRPIGLSHYIINLLIQCIRKPLLPRTHLNHKKPTPLTSRHSST